MAFRFSLQAVLRLRRGLEDQEEKKLLAVAALAASAKAQTARLEEIHLLQRRVENEELESSLAIGAIVQFHAACEERRRSLHEELMEKQAALESQRSEQVARYRLARQKREILEALRDQHRAIHDVESSKREQLSMDEPFFFTQRQTER